MFDTGKHKFSNPLYTYRQSINKAAHHSRSPLTERKFQNKNISKSKSPINIHKQNYSCFMEGIDDYRLSSKIKFTQQKMKKIIHTLSIQATTQRNYQKRLMQKQMYVDYNYNPFLIQKNQTTKRANRNDDVVLANNREIKIKNMITKLNNLTLKRHQATKIFENLDNNSNIFQPILKNEQKKKQLAKKLKKVQKNNIIQPKKHINIEQHIIDPLDELDNIVRLKQNNYNDNIIRSQNFNIFKVIVDENDKSLINSKEILKKYSFCHQPVDIRSKETKSINVFKFLSNNNRLIHLKNGSLVPSIFKINEQSQIIDTQTVQFDGLMAVSTGMIQPEIMEYFFSGQKSNKQRDQEKQSSLVEQPQLYFKDNHIHAGTIKDAQKYDIQQKNYYIQQNLTTNQKVQVKIQNFYKEKLQKLLKIEQNLHSDFIHDKILKQKLSECKKKILQTQLKNLQDNVYIENQKDLDRIIRYNKVNKNRVHRIKVNAIEESLNMNKIYQQKIKNKNNNKQKNNRSSINNKNKEYISELIKQNL